MTSLAVVLTAFAIAVSACSSDTSPGDAQAASNTRPATRLSSGPSTATTASAGASGTPAGTSSSSRPGQREPCAHNAAAKAVLVHIRTQHLWLCRGHRSVFDSPVTSGIPGEDTHTPTGTYEIQSLDRDTSLTLIDGSSFTVKYWIPFDAPLFGFHDSPWQRFPYGSRQYRTRGSHGCVHLPLRTIAFLYRWAEIGTLVRIGQ